ncbi:MAG TPA: phosphoribosylglycinamide formyltransferase [Planctomycetaceae bacterium]|nr:phosphoribosylglycinamide formyltransferase [Planctomycetaceae bacterium]
MTSHDPPASDVEDRRVVRPLAAPLDRPVRLGVLISGGGTTLMNFVRAIRAGDVDAEIPLVIASRGDCSGIGKARAAGLACDVIARADSASVDEFSQRIFARLRGARVDLVTLAGFLSLLRIPDDFRHRVMNIHPALIPAFCGKGYHGAKVHEAALARGVKVSGCTVHFADNEYDHGPIIVQRSVPVFDADTPESLAARVFTEECQAYPEAIRLFAQGRLEIAERRVRVLPPLNSQLSTLNS